MTDIFARCDDAEELAGGGQRAFEADVLLRHAARSILAGIGEAAKNLGDLPEQMPDVPWTQIARMRDRVTHRYFDVDYAVVWQTLTTDLPRLAQVVREFLSRDD